MGGRACEKGGNALGVRNREGTEDQASNTERTLGCLREAAFAVDPFLFHGLFLLRSLFPSDFFLTALSCTLIDLQAFLLSDSALRTR